MISSVCTRPAACKLTYAALESGVRGSEPVAFAFVAPDPRLPVFGRLHPEPAQPDDADRAAAAEAGLDVGTYMLAKSMAEYTLVLTWDECVTGARLLRDPIETSSSADGSTDGAGQ